MLSVFFSHKIFLSFKNYFLDFTFMAPEGLRPLFLLFPFHIFNYQGTMMDARYKFPIIHPLNSYSMFTITVADHK